MKTYGLIVADNGSDLYVQGTYDTRWDNGVLNPAFSAIHASDFEVVAARLAAVRAARRDDAPRRHALPPRRHAARRAARVRAGIGAGRSGRRSRSRAPAGSRRRRSPSRRTSRSWRPRAPETSSSFRRATGAHERLDRQLLRPGRTRANNVQILLSSDGTGRATVRNNAAGALDLVVDVNGYYE